MLNKIKSHKDFIVLDRTIVFSGYEAIGYFPYEKEAVFNGVAAVPRSVFAGVEEGLGSFMDNKIVVVFKDLVRFGTSDFAIQFKDAFCRIGSLDQIKDYIGNPLSFYEEKELLWWNSMTLEEKFYKTIAWLKD